MNFNQNKPFFVGLIGGVLLSLILALFFQAVGVKSPDHLESKYIAQVNQEFLSREAARQRVADKLIPVENDRYRILRDTVDEWIHERLIEKEAKAEGAGISEFYQRRLWDNIRISMDDVTAYYEKNRASYSQPLESVKKDIFDVLRAGAYEKLKDELLQTLRDKYEVKIFLDKPDNYVEGITMPPGEKSAALPKPSAETGPAAGAYPSKGPQNASVTIEEFADFTCVFCHRVQPTLDQIFQNYGGKVRLVFRHFPLSSTPGQGPFLAHEAAACAHEQGKFWEYHDKLFTSSENMDLNRLTAMAAETGLDEAGFRNCISQGTYRAAIAADKKEGAAKGVQGTPTFFVNGTRLAGAVPYESFAQAINGTLNPGSAPAAAPAPAKAEMPQLDLPERPSAGTEKGPITLVEFSDFHCPFCQRVEPTLDRLMKDYEGKIRRVWRHFPLPMHAGAERSHQASECAHEQGKFWDYHRKLFEKVGQYRTDDALVALAKETGLNEKDFQNCLSSNKYESRVQEDIRAGQQAGVRGTPAVFVNGIMVSGAQPYENFQQRVEGVLDPSKAAAVPPAQPAAPSAPAADTEARVSFGKLDADLTTGPKDAVITLVEFSDFHCPFCKRAAPTVDKVMDDYPGKIRRAWKHFPLSIHPGADRTHEASQCLAEQGKFWEFHDRVMTSQTNPSSDAELTELAESLGANMKKFKSCFTGSEVKATVKSNIEEGSAAGVRGTPTFFVNGVRIRGAQPYESFKSIIDTELKAKS